MSGREFQQNIRLGSLGTGNPAQYDYETIAAHLKGANPELLGAAGRAYAQVKGAFDKAENGLAQHVKHLNAVWQGNAQELGLADVRRLSEASAALASASEQFSKAMDNAYVTMKASQRMPNKTTPLGALPPTDPLQAQAIKKADDKVAQEHLAKTNTGLASAFEQIPTALTLNLPKPRDGGTRFGGGSSDGGSATGGGSAGGPTGIGGPVGGSPPNSPAGGHTPVAGAGEVNVPAPPTSWPGGADAGSPLQGHPGGSGNPSSLAGAQSPGPNGSGPAVTAPPGPASPVAGGGGGYGTGGPLPGGNVLPYVPGGGSQNGPAGGRPAQGGLPPGSPGASRSGVGGTTSMPPAGGLGGAGSLRPGGVLGGGATGGMARSSGAGGSNSMDGQRPRFPNGGVIGSGTAFPGSGSGHGRSSSAGIPMGTGPAAPQKKDGEHDTWLIDDEDLWNDETVVAPRVLGDPG